MFVLLFCTLLFQCTLIQSSQVPLHNYNSNTTRYFNFQTGQFELQEEDPKSIKRRRSIQTVKHFFSTNPPAIQQDPFGGIPTKSQSASYEHSSETLTAVASAQQQP